MNGRERVFRSIEFDSPDRIPHMHSYRYATLERHGDSFLRLLSSYPSDFVQEIPTKASLDTSDKGTAVDEWGVTWVKVQDGYLGQPKGHPLESWEAFEEYHIPDPSAGSSLLTSSRPREEIKRDGDLYLCAFGGNLFERLQWLRGMKNVFVDLATGRKELLRLADRIVGYNIQLSKILVEEGADGVVFTDDWGTQDRLMINPSMWRSFFKPRYRRIFRCVHRLGAKVHFHSDGYISPIIPDLIEIGADVLNPQLNVHDMDALARMCGGRICVRGGLDRQVVLPRGSPADVRRHVKEVIERFAVHDGGWIACGELGPDVPIRNCEEMMSCFFRLGRYAPHGNR